MLTTVIAEGASYVVIARRDADDGGVDEAEVPARVLRKGLPSPQYKRRLFCDVAFLEDAPEVAVRAGDRALVPARKVLRAF